MSRNFTAMFQIIFIIFGIFPFLSCEMFIENYLKIACTTFTVQNKAKSESFYDLKNPESVGLPNLGSVPHEASCQGKCGQIQHFPCTCDAKCVVYRNCCEDFASVCPSLLEEAYTKFKNFLNLDIQCCVPLRKLVISSCRNKPNVKASNLESMENIKAVTDITNGLVYKNLEIFRCNNDGFGKPAKWSLVNPSVNKFTDLQGTFLDELLLRSYFVLIDKPNSNQSYLTYSCSSDTYYLPIGLESQNISSLQEKFLSHLSFVVCYEQSSIYINSYVMEQHLSPQGRVCLPKYDISVEGASLNPNKNIELNDFFALSFSNDILAMKYVYVKIDRFHPWDTVVCKLSNIIKHSGKTKCNWIFESCNKKAGFVLRGNVCKRLFSYNFVLLYFKPLRALDHYTFLSHFMYCLLKQDVIPNILNEWLPSKEWHFDSSYKKQYMLTFIADADHTQIYTLSTADNYYVKDFVYVYSHAWKMKSGMKSTCGASKFIIDTSNISIKTNSVCFSTNTLLTYSESDGKFKYNPFLRNWVCFSPKQPKRIVKESFYSNLYACFNSSNNFYIAWLVVFSGYLGYLNVTLYLRHFLN